MRRREAITFELQKATIQRDRILRLDWPAIFVPRLPAESLLFGGKGPRVDEVVVLLAGIPPPAQLAQPVGHPKRGQSVTVRDIGYAARLVNYSGRCQTTMQTTGSGQTTDPQRSVKSLV